MIYVEDALGQLRSYFDSIGLIYELGTITEKQAELVVEKNSITVRTWFDADKQLFGFDMIQGGCKTYSSIDEFSGMFKTYLSLHTDFLPKAKVVADTFEEALNISTVYDNFFGNSNDGYSALFRVLGSNNIVTVSKTTGFYIARYGYNSEDNKTFNTITEYHYEVDEVGNIVLIPTIYSYLNELTNRYDNDDSVEIERIGVDEFNFKVEDICIHAKVEFMYKSITYNVLDISGQPIQLSFVLEDDPYSLSKLYLQCKSPYDDYLATLEDICTSEDTTEELPLEDESASTSEMNEKIVEETIESEVYSESDNEELDLPNESDIEEPSIKEDLNSEVEEMSLKAVWGTSDSAVAIQFIVDNNIYIMSVDKATEIGVPVERIEDRVFYVKKHGIVMTEDEIKLKKFSKDISNDDEFCNQLYDMIFS